MIVVDKNNNTITEYDLDLGYLEPDKRYVRHHNKKELIPEKGHYEILHEYPNGGQDLIWVIDEPGQKEEDAWDEYEDVQRYIEYTEAELSQRRIDELKMKLFETDYITSKIVEGESTVEDYADLIQQRKEWRAEIRSLEPLITK